jgi:hypothetical protein
MIISTARLVRPLEARRSDIPQIPAVWEPQVYRGREEMASSVAGPSTLPSTGDSFTLRLTGVPLVHNLDPENYCRTYSDWVGLRAELHTQSRFRLSRQIHLTVDGEERLVKFQPTESLRPEQWTWEVATSV